ncbi:hypothetical protein [Variovorax sp. E3]
MQIRFPRRLPRPAMLALGAAALACAAAAFAAARMPPGARAGACSWG